VTRGSGTPPWRAVLLSLGLVTLLGLGSKMYAGPAQGWVRNSLSGVFYEVFWCLFVLALRPGWRPWKIAGSVLVITCFLEFLQLWKPPFLEAIRDLAPGRALIGNFFTWTDFPYYGIGCLLGWAWMRRLGRVRPIGAPGGEDS
jgi:hypothetical protein